MRMQGRRTTRTTAADHQYIGRMVRCQLSIILNRAVTFQQGGQFNDRPVPFVGTEPDWSIGTRSKIGMIFVNQLVAICGRKLLNRLLATGIPSLVDDLLQCVDVHDFPVERLDG